MTQAASAQPDPCPPSAVSHGAGLIGLVGLLAWIALARHFGWDGPSAALVCCVATGLPMVLWSIFVDKVHLRPSTGIDWSHPRAVKDVLDISTIKLTGLWLTWSLIAAIYATARWYWTGNYQFSMAVFIYASPFLFFLSIPYVIWIDRYLKQPRDGAWHFGAMISGQSGWDREQIWHHLRAWAVKGFFLAFMLSIVPGGYADIVNANVAEIATNPVWIANWLIIAMFLVDVQFATVGYVLTFKPLDSHIRTANPFMAGWAAALICYPPFILMGDNGPLNYHVATADWAYWFEGHTALLAVWGVWLVFLTGVYAWATVAFGIRFSNLTHRGILTHGPYRWTKHPAYLSKNAFWWFSTMPFLVTSGSWQDGLRNTVLLAAVSGVYYWRARTEERHLMADPDYAAYAAWMERHGPVPRAIGWLTGRRAKVDAVVAPAE
ncbi:MULTISPECIES: isoprenylcysteine carboxylmethyltransferase family protein [Pseudomonadota]|uniref:isoprenylcysteine carboxylmethyltransferase family protein n=1 Tax=Pseudomonadota TaxID=1224 RepID=UPI000769BE2C|nr:MULTISPECIES: isoprenylcysteine carboxylmethyltransferase family protein [Pseudomonadota]MAF60396.1 protein-S-isoprenylcysteine methyltransferase [Blastomonas sp.]|tara:strand:+ start:52302 stop:53606 length:1305 start_codon:yes stop_codon:yes gene_type:complete